MKLLLSTLAITAVLTIPSSAQRASPHETVSATAGGAKISIEYGRPSLKGRSIEELFKELPADRMWRAGVDQVTTLTTETALSVGGKTVPAGKYSVYVHVPEAGDYSLVLNKDLGVPLKQIFAAAPPALANEPWPHIADYTKAIGDKEVVRAPMRKVEARM